MQEGLCKTPLPRNSLRILPLESEMCEGLIGFGHTVRIVTLLHCCSFTITCSHKLIGEALRHRLLSTGTAIVDEPANGKRSLALGAHLCRNLIGCTTNAARANLDQWRRIVHRLAEDFYRWLSALLLNDVEGIIHDTLRDGFLSIEHERIDELGNKGIGILRILDARTKCGTTFSHEMLMRMCLTTRAESR